MSLPIIGITSDLENNGGYSKYPWYALRQNYCSSVTKSGGLPIILVNEIHLVDQYSELLDGLIISGGDFDINPEYFGEKINYSSVKTKSARTEFEIKITQRFLELNKPVFGICGGQQLLAVILGCTLWQHIPADVEGAMNHEQPNPRHEAGHYINIKKNTKLYDIVKTDKMNVNSAHHQSVNKTPKNITINAIAPDGIIEGIEDHKYKWCMGVQWHPEFLISSHDQKIYNSFISACK